MAGASLKLDIGIHFLEKIAQHPQRTSLQRKLREQLAKDLNTEPIDVPHHNLPAWLADWINAFVNSGGDLGQLLYRVDIDEDQWRGQTDISPQKLAIKILEREAQKVIFRSQHSGEL